MRARLLVILLPLLGFEGLFCQTSHTHSQNDLKLSIMVDGARSPDLISDALAFRHFVTLLLDLKSFSPELKDLRLRQINFSEADGHAFVAALSTLPDRLSAIRASKQSVQSSALTDAEKDAALTSLIDQEGTVFSEAFTGLSFVLSPEGFTKLRFHLKDQVKTHIVIYGSGPS